MNNKDKSEKYFILSAILGGRPGGCQGECGGGPQCDEARRATQDKSSRLPSVPIRPVINMASAYDTIAPLTPFSLQSYDGGNAESNTAAPLSLHKKFGSLPHFTNKMGIPHFLFAITCGICLS